MTIESLAQLAYQANPNIHYKLYTSQMLYLAKDWRFSSWSTEERAIHLAHELARRTRCLDKGKFIPFSKATMEYLMPLNPIASDLEVFITAAFTHFYKQLQGS